MRIETHVRFETLPNKLRNEFASGKRPSRPLLENNHSIAQKAGILPAHFDLQYQYLSSVAHSQPVFVKTMSKHDPFCAEIHFMLKEAVEYTAAYLALTTHDFAMLCPKAKTAFDAKFLDYVGFVAELYQTPFPAD